MHSIMITGIRCTILRSLSLAIDRTCSASETTKAHLVRACNDTLAWYLSRATERCWSADMPADELIEHYPCALLRTALLLQGELYVFSRHVCFKTDQIRPMSTKPRRAAHSPAPSRLSGILFECLRKPNPALFRSSLAKRRS